MKPRPRFVVFSPDELPIEPRTFATREAAERARDRWCQRFVAQGYYAAFYGHVPLTLLPQRCRIEEI